MLQKVKMDLKGRLKIAMNERDIKVPRLAQLIGIPKDRIYAWYRDNTAPKGEDTQKIEKWLNEETFTKDKSLDQIIGEIQEQLLRIEAHLEVYEATIAGILSKNPEDFPDKLGGLRRAVKEVVNRRFDELQKRSLVGRQKGIDDLEKTAF